MSPPPVRSRQSAHPIPLRHNFSSRFNRASLYALNRFNFSHYGRDIIQTNRLGIIARSVR